jgi:hypothetical protein
VTFHAGLRAAVVALGLMQGAWMTFDGTRALVVGDYVTPSNGVHAGQLGPWSHVVSAVGIPPRSTAMKLVFVVYGLSWLIISVGFAVHAAWASPAMLIAAIATLWYLPIGTIFAIVQLAALIWLRRTA